MSTSQQEMSGLCPSGTIPVFEQGCASSDIGSSYDGVVATIGVTIEQISETKGDAAKDAP